VTLRIISVLFAFAIVGCRPSVTLTPSDLIPSFNRNAWPHWIDADGDCQDARQEVLIEESLEPVTFTDDRRCRVAAGLWRDSYSGQIFRDPSALDVDHLVPLANAHDSGAWNWITLRKRDYANDLSDPDHLVAVSASLNRQKGARTPATWRPPDREAWCWYAQAWTAVKARWELQIVKEERAALGEMQASCR
jgi:hypothetical protein